MGKSKKKKKNNQTGAILKKDSNTHQTPYKEAETSQSGITAHTDVVTEEPYNMQSEKITVSHRLKWYMLNGKCRFLMTLL